MGIILKYWNCICKWGIQQKKWLLKDGMNYAASGKHSTQAIEILQQKKS